MKSYGFLVGLVLSLSMASCSSSKSTLPYFQDISSIKEGTLTSMDFMPEIRPDDELFINVTSANPAATAVYNLPYVNPATRQSFIPQTNARNMTYVVSSKGDIDFPLLGKIHVAGMNTEQLAAYLEGRIANVVENPDVTVQLVNFQVHVAGEVATPGPVKIDRNRFTILDAITSAGDLTPYGERSNVLIIREENGERKFAHLDLTSSDILNSPYYYVKQNDYIYVEPNSIRQANSRYNQDNAFKLSVTSTIVSAASVIASLVIALTVK